MRRLLRHTIIQEKATVAVGAELQVSGPQYVRVRQRRGLIQPLRGDEAAGLAGRLPDVTQVVYLDASEGAVMAGERLGVVMTQTTLAEAATAGSKQISLATPLVDAAGRAAQIGSQEACETRRVRQSEGTVATLEAPLVRSHEPGEDVAVVRQYLVMAALDEAGQGHHWKAILRELVV